MQPKPRLMPAREQPASPVPTEARSSAELDPIGLHGPPAFVARQVHLGGGAAEEPDRADFRGSKPVQEPGEIVGQHAAVLVHRRDRKG